MRCLTLLLCAVPALAAAAPQVITHSGRALDVNGEPVNGAQTAVFRLYDALDQMRWEETHTVVFADGYYAVPLGSTTPFDPALFAEELELGVVVGGSALGREPLAAVPHALSVDGAVRVSASPPVCDATTRGSLRWQSNALEVCAEEGWTALADAGQVGSGMVDYVYAENASGQSLSGTIPWDDSVPQISEGGRVVQVSITPKSASNLLVFDGIVHWTEPTNTANYLTLALYRQGQSGALSSAVDAASNGNGRCTGNPSYPQICSMPFHVTLPAGSTSPQTYELRLGLDVGPVYINQGFNGRKLGGTLRSSLSITEIAP